MQALRALIQEMTPTTGTFVVAEVAEKIMVAAEERLNGELAAVQRELTVRVIASELRSIQFSHRRQEQQINRRKNFDNALADLVDAGHVFTKAYCVDGADTWKTVGDMTGADHRFVAGTYQKTSITTGLLAEFHRQVAKKIGQRRTADVFDEEKYIRLQASILKAA